jgi:hypothetical protein
MLSVGTTAPDIVMNALKIESFELLISILEETWASLRVDEKARTSRKLLAHRILKAAIAGEKDPARLRIEAASGAVTFAL